MTGTVCAFKSSHPTVIASEEDNRRRYREWRDAIFSFADNYPGFKPFAITFSGGAECYFKGLAGEDHTHTPGPLWRMGKDCWVPSKRSNAGKELAKQVESIKATGLKKLPGMPDMASVDNRLYSSGQKLIDGVLWVTWGCPVDAVEKSQWSNDDLNRDLWTEAKLSEYYLAVEAVKKTTKEATDSTTT